MRILAVNDFGPKGFRWITLKRVTVQWEDPHGVVRFWEVADRTTRRGLVDGVAIIARVLRRGHEPHVVVISQFRPPLANYCLELPAGLVDRGEDAATAAVRELREETGYVGRVVDVGPPCCSDPGMTSANMQIAVLEVDGDAPENQNVKPHFDDGEFISAELVPQASLLQYLLGAQREHGWEVDARLMALATGLHQGTALEAAAACGPGDSPLAGARGFGSLLPDDSELGQAVEAALAATAAAATAEPSTNGSMEGCAAADKAAEPDAQQPSSSPAAAEGWWPRVKACICTYQFATGLASGVALGGATAAALCRAR